MADFGKTSAGKTVEAITLRAGDIQAVVLTLGAILQSVRLNGVAHDLTLGSSSVADYEGDMHYFGALVAPVVNRLRDAQATINGRHYSFDANMAGGHSLHSGADGTHRKLWRIVTQGDSHVEMAIDLPDGEGGFPGNRTLVARFTVSAPASLRLEVLAQTDAPTIFNAANHSYWTLNGAPTWSGHHLKIAADRYLPTDDAALVTGTIAPVDKAMDFRKDRVITEGHPPLDHNFCLSDERVALRDVAWLSSPDGDLAMTLATTEAGLQIYDGRNARRPWASAYEGLAFEAQGWPDAPNNKEFPSIELLPDAPVKQITEWRFDRRVTKN